MIVKRKKNTDVFMAFRIDPELKTAFQMAMLKRGVPFKHVMTAFVKYMLNPCADVILQESFIEQGKELKDAR